MSNLNELNKEELAKMTQAAEGELSDDAMEGVAGGNISVQHVFNKLLQEREEMEKKSMEEMSKYRAE